MRFVLTALLLLAPAAAAADNAACANIEAPLAYNACLAKQGPRAGAVHASAAPAALAPRRRAYAAPVRRAPHGRMRMEFQVTPRR